MHLKKGLDQEKIRVAELAYYDLKSKAETMTLRDIDAEATIFRKLRMRELKVLTSKLGLFVPQGTDKNELVVFITDPLKMRVCSYDRCGNTRNNP